MYRWFALVLLLSACSSSIDTCPAVVEYDKSMQRQASEELSKLPPDSVISAMIVDYGKLRAKLRACQ